MSCKPDFHTENALIQRAMTFPQPRDGLDLTKASQDELEALGIYPRPDPKEQPELFADWDAIFGAQVTVVPPEVQEVLASWQLNTNPSPSASGASISHVDASSNWSGAYDVPTDNTMFVLVGGEWTLPALALPAAEYRPPNAKHYVCSTFVGLDGQRRYLDSSLPQIGVMQTLTLLPPAPPHISAHAFFQWWDREQLCHTYLRFLHLAVHSGDVVRGAVWAKTPTEVRCYLRNVTTNHLAIIGCLSPTVTLPSGPVQLTITGATAEWILERPTKVCTHDLYPFPKFTDTEFDRCWGGVARAAGPAQSHHDLLRARYIRMYDTLYDPIRQTFLSLPERRSEISFGLEYAG